MKFTHNVLVISDIHLGEDLSPSADEGTTLACDLAERQLVAFLRHYTRRRRDGLPWRLVINGDLIDFQSIWVDPTDPRFEDVDIQVDSDSRDFGIRRGPLAAAAMLDLVVVRHAEFFSALARFIARGNRVEIIAGNHDTEFQFEETQIRFRSAVADAWRALPASSRQGARPADEVAAGIHFHPWFFYEEGQMWIEHGHQYDECCSFAYQLEPRLPGTNELLMNVDWSGTRYITNRVREAAPHQQDDWSAFGYFQFAIELGFRGAGNLVRAYANFAAALLRVWRGNRGRKRRQPYKAHHERLHDLADQWSLPSELLISLDGLRRRPVISNLVRLAGVLMLDKVVAYTGTILVSILMLILIPMPWSVAFIVLSFLLAHGVTKKLARGRIIDPSLALSLASGRILRKVDAQFVVMGHTHEPVNQTVESRTYFNTGTWLPSGKAGVLHAFTHVVLRYSEHGAKATLCQWRDGGSRAFTPGWVPTGSGRDEAQTKQTDSESDNAESVVV